MLSRRSLGLLHRARLCRKRRTSVARFVDSALYTKKKKVYILSFSPTGLHFETQSLGSEGVRLTDLRSIRSWRIAN
jgi:hypothetical protein